MPRDEPAVDLVAEAARQVPDHVPRLLALPLIQPGEALVEDAVAGRGAVTDHDATLLHGLTLPSDVDAARQGELKQDGPGQCVRQLGGVRSRRAGLVVGQQEEQVFDDQHVSHASPGRGYEPGGYKRTANV